MNQLLKKLLNYLRYGRKRGGLFDEKDERNFGSDAIYKPQKSDLVIQSFIVFDPAPLDQLDSDFCVGFGGAYDAEATEKQVSSGAYAFAAGKKAAGADYKTWGLSILQMCRGRQKFGICKKELWDYEKGRRNFFANWDNIPQAAHDDAAMHKSQAYFEVIRPWGWSMFDTLRAYLWHFKDKKVLIDTGNNAHKITIIGYNAEKDLLVARDTYGLRTYEEGIRYIGRAEAETLFTPYIQLDIERSLAELLVNYNNKAIKLIGNPDCYLVLNGEKHLLKNEAIAWAFNIWFFPTPKDLYEVTEEEFELIPLGAPADFYQGPSHQLVIRVLEKVKPGEVEQIINAD